MKSPRVKVLQLLPECHDRSHDPEELSEQIVAAFPREEFEVTSAYLQGSPVASQPTSRSEHVCYFGFPDFELKGLRLGVKRLLFEYCKNEHFDVVICHRYKPVSLMLSLSKRLPIPVCIGISHGFGEYKTLWRKLFARLSIDRRWHFVGVSDAVRNHLVEQSCGFSLQNTSAIPNAFDIDDLEQHLLGRTEAREQLGLPRDVRIVGAIGRLVRVKGHVHLIRAFGSVAARFPDDHLAVIGSGKEEGVLRAEIERLGLTNRVHLLGWRSRAKQFVRAFDIWTMPSLSEGFGLALLEGMCGRLPVIGSDIPAMAPMLRRAGGLCVPPADENLLASAISTYLEKDSATLRMLGEQAYSYARQNHNISAYREAYLNLVKARLVRYREG